MITLDQNILHIDFSSIFKGANGSIRFNRTLRLPDDDTIHYLPCSLGEFTLRHIEDSTKIPLQMRKKGGVMLPIYQAEAMWLDFDADFPIALKIGCGKINAISGKPWCEDLLEDENDYIVLPDQPWLDGFSISKDIVRQFVAMPLGSGITVEEQLTDAGDVGGIQVIAYPMTVKAYQKVKETREEQADHDIRFSFSPSRVMQNDEMGLAAGAKIHQQIYKDPYGISSWQRNGAVRCFVHLLNSESWYELTGERMPRPPITAKEYQEAGLPWYHYYSDKKSLEGSKILNAIKSIGEFSLFKQDTPSNAPIDVGQPVTIARNKVSDGSF